jgi:hypothetical protein
MNGISSPATETGEIVPPVLYTQINSLPSKESNESNGTAQFPVATMSIEAPNQIAFGGIIGISASMSRDPSFNPSITASPSTAATSPFESPSEALLPSIYNFKKFGDHWMKQEELNPKFKRDKMEVENINLLRERVKLLTNEELKREIEEKVVNYVKWKDAYGKTLWQENENFDEEKNRLDETIKCLEQQLKNVEQIVRIRLDARYQVLLNKAEKEAETDRIGLEKKISDLEVKNKQSDEKLSNLHGDLTISEDQNRRSDEKLENIGRQLKEWKALAGSHLE